METHGTLYQVVCFILWNRSLGGLHIFQRILHVNGEYRVIKFTMEYCNTEQPLLDEQDLKYTPMSSTNLQTVG